MRPPVTRTYQVAILGAGRSIIGEFNLDNDKPFDHHYMDGARGRNDKNGDDTMDNFAILQYNRKQDVFVNFSVAGTAKSIWDLYWQLTHNYQPQDGTAIGEIIVSNIAGVKINMSRGFADFCGRL